jgi:hypothetical protein
VRRRADPALSFAIGVALTSVGSYPTVAGARTGAIDVSAGAARIVAMLAIACCAVHVVATLVARLMSPSASSPPPRPGVVCRLDQRADAKRRKADAA